MVCLVEQFSTKIFFGCGYATWIFNHYILYSLNKYGGTNKITTFLQHTVHFRDCLVRKVVHCGQIKRLPIIRIWQILHLWGSWHVFISWASLVVSASFEVWHTMFAFGLIIQHRLWLLRVGASVCSDVCVCCAKLCCTLTALTNIAFVAWRYR